MISGALRVIVACDSDRGIGKNGGIPWKIPADMARFRSLTVYGSDLSKPTIPARINNVIMGRATWDSLPAKYRPLPDRRNIVVTSNTSLQFPEGVVRASSLQDAVAKAEGFGGKAFVIGGQTLYDEVFKLGRPLRIHMTSVAGSFDCDRFFPDVFRLSRDVRMVEPESIAGECTGPDGQPLKYWFENYDVQF